MTTPKADPLRGLVPFTIVATGLSALFFLYLYLGQKPVPEAHGLRKELGEGFGMAGLGALGLIYGRSVLKLLLNQGDLMQRLLPEPYQGPTLSVSRQALTLLNRTHRYVGAAALVIFVCHAVLMGTARWNAFLELVLTLLAWQGLFGLFLVIRFPLAALKRYSYLVHAQLFSGVLIGLFAAFGHLLLP